MRDYRLGDDVDDFCIKCKRITNHSIVSLLNTDPAKVRCRTCYNDHDFRRCEIPPSKKDLKKAALFNEVLASSNLPAAEGVAIGDAEAAADVDEAVDGEETPAPAAAKEAEKGKRGRKSKA